MSDLKHKYILCPDVLELISKNEELESQLEERKTWGELYLKYSERVVKLEAQLAKEKRRRITSTRINNELHERIEGLEDKTLVEELESQLAEIDKFMASMDTNAGRKKDGYYHEAFETAHAMVKKAIINREKSDD